MIFKKKNYILSVCNIEKTCGETEIELIFCLNENVKVFDTKVHIHIILYYLTLKSTGNSLV